MWFFRAFLSHPIQMTRMAWYYASLNRRSRHDLGGFRNFAAITVAALRQSTEAAVLSSPAKSPALRESGATAVLWSRKDARDARRRLARRIFRHNDLLNTPRWNLIILLVVIAAGIAWNGVGRLFTRYQLAHYWILIEPESDVDQCGDLYHSPPALAENPLCWRREAVCPRRDACELVMRAAHAQGRSLAHCIPANDPRFIGQFPVFSFDGCSTLAYSRK